MRFEEPQAKPRMLFPGICSFFEVANGPHCWPTVATETCPPTESNTGPQRHCGATVARVSKPAKAWRPADEREPTDRSQPAFRRTTGEVAVSRLSRTDR